MISIRGHKDYQNYNNNKQYNNANIDDDDESRYRNIDDHLTSILIECIISYKKGDTVSSRDLGRKLAASAAKYQTTATTTALQELKKCFGCLANFLTMKDDVFVSKMIHGKDVEFMVGLTEKAKKKRVN